MDVDSAYVDRADIVQYVGPPSRDAIYFILRSCVIELVRAGIIRAIVSLFQPMITPTYVLLSRARNHCGSLLEQHSNDKHRARSPFDFYSIGC
jgi:hypothetical protein